jgi:pyruvate dehydrogenase E1 component alpha subunit
LSEDGSEPAEAGPDLLPEDLVGLFQDMVAARRTSERMVTLQRQGRVGVFSQIDGQEAATVGAIRALDHDRDWIFRAYREEVALHAYPPDRMPPRNISLGTQIPQAAGAAWALKLDGTPACVLAFCGDGSTSEGDFYEGLNLAGVLRLPLVVMCVNNGWAISTPRSIQTASETIAIKATAVGITGAQVDGNDVLAVYATAKTAVEQARAGGGPTLIEAVTYLYGAHTTADDPTRYVPPDELEAWKQRDPIVRFRRYLQAVGVWTEAIEDGGIAAGELEATRRAELFTAMGDAAPDSLFDNVYHELPPRLRRQREELRAELTHGAP